MAAKGIVKGIITAAVICGLAAGGWGLYRHFGGNVSHSSEKVFVQKVATLNTVDGANLFAHDFAGVIVAQKTVDVKYDTEQTVSELLVKDGDQVKKGDKLLTYDVDKIQVSIDTAKLEIERMQNEIESCNNEIAQYERDKQTADGDAAVSITASINQKRSQIKKTEFEIKKKNLDLSKMESSLDSAYVVAPIDGTVKDVREPGGNSGEQEMMMYDENSSPDVIMKIAAAGDYRVKGVFNEQNSAQIKKGAKVFLRSRIDDSLVLRGTISEIDSNPQSSNQEMYNYGMNDEQTTSSKYAFYVEPESLEGFLLGQHVLIEMDNGQQDADKKEGLWIYSSFVLWDGDRNYVWAKDAHEQIEKRYVEIGEINDEGGDCQILSGLTIDDYIAYPADYIEAGLSTTMNQSDKDIPDNVIIGDPNEGMEGMEGFEGMEGMEGIEGMEGMEGIEDMPAMDEGNMKADADGNMTYTDEDGDTYQFDQDGNLLAGGEQLFDQETSGADDAQPDAEN